MNPTDKRPRNPLIDLGYRLGSWGLMVGVVLMVVGIATLFALHSVASHIFEAGLCLTVGSALLGLGSFVMTMF